jgi:hypothetical protein
MATNVYAWPPVGLTGWELTVLDPVSESRTLLQGQPVTSGYRARRRAATAVVPMLGPDGANSGYVEMLKRYLSGVHLVRVECQSAIWFNARSRLPNAIGRWLSGSTEGLWLSGSTEGYWSSGSAYGTAGTVDGWPAVTVTGLPPSQIVVRPHELVRLLAPDEDAQSARAVRVTRSDAAGEAVIRLETALTGAGPISIGDAESVVFKPLGYPRAVQDLQGGGAYTWNFEEAFEDDPVYGTWAEVNPWA